MAMLPEIRVESATWLPCGIRHGTKRDAAEIYDYEQTLPAGWSLKALCAPQSLVAVARHEIVGYCLCSLRGSLVDILRVQVLPRYRRQRVASQLFNHIKVHATKHSRRVEFHVPDDLLGLHLFLRDQGFTCLNIVRASSPTGQDHYRFAWGQRREDTD